MAQTYVDLSVVAKDCTALKYAGALSGGRSGRWGWGKRECLVTTSKIGTVDYCCVHRFPDDQKVCCQCKRTYGPASSKLSELVTLLQFKLLNDELGI